MKAIDIKPGMLVYHLTNYKIPMVVVVVNLTDIKFYVGHDSNIDEEQCVYCEWVGPNGKFYQKSLRPVHLSKYGSDV